MAYLQASERRQAFAAKAAYLPGIILVAVVTSAAYGLHGLSYLSVLSPMILAILLGMLVANTAGIPERALPGVGLSGKRLLRIAVALLGLQLTLTQIGEIGVLGVVAAAIALVSTFVFTVWLGRLLGVDRGLSYLLAGGTSICGASAIGAVGSSLKAKDENIAYAVACITVCGTVAMFIYPLLKTGLYLDSFSYGQWVGLSVHEVAQVVGASFQAGMLDGQIAVITKLTRVVMLAPVVICLSLFVVRSTGDAASGAGARTVPLFILCFAALVVINSFGLVPESLRSVLVGVTPVLLTAALGALGLGTHFQQLRARGLRPLLLATISTLFIAGISLLLVKVTI